MDQRVEGWSAKEGGRAQATAFLSLAKDNKNELSQQTNSLVTKQTYPISQKQFIKSKGNLPQRNTNPC